MTAIEKAQLAYAIAEGKKILDRWKADPKVPRTVVESGETFHKSLTEWVANG